MATYAPTDLHTKPLPSGDGDAYIYDGQVSATSNFAATDFLDAVRIPAGTRLAKIDLAVTVAFGASCTFDVLLVPVDGSSSTTVLSGATAGVHAVGRTSLNFLPLTVAKDSVLRIDPTAVGTGAQGTMAVIAMGMGYGPK